MSIQPVSYQINAANHIEIGGVDLVDLAGEFGTPLYVLDAATIRHQARQYTQAFRQYYPNSMVCYASKALSTVALIQFLAIEGLGFDVVSGGELFTALTAKVDPSTILFHGNNKSKFELEMAVVNGVQVVVDHLEEIVLLDQLSRAHQRDVPVLIRLKPEIEAHTHDYIKTGQIDSKFGVDRMHLMPVIQAILDTPYLKYQGIHAHIGSQIFDIEPFEDLAFLLTKYASKIHQTFGLETAVLNFGGGIGISYTADDDPPDIVQFVRRVTQRLMSACDTFHLIYPKVIVEPGRSIVGQAGVSLYTVGAVKEIPAIKTYLFVDGGMADNPRPIMYQAGYTFALANKAADAVFGPYSIAGKFCESGDILAKDVLLPKAQAGDILVTYATGAYHYSMSSNYNRFCRPAMVMVDQGRTNLIVQRETFENLISRDLCIN